MAINTHSEYVILIAFPRQQWLSELAPMSRTHMMPLLLLPAIFSLYVVLGIFYWSQHTPRLILFIELAPFRVFCSLLIVWRSEVIFLAL